MNKMKNKVIGLLAFLFMNALNITWAVEPTAVNTEVVSTFEIRADGLACPYCAYGIEKKFMAIKGVKYVDVNLEQGKVLVTGDVHLNFEEQQLKTLFNDAGFTYRTMNRTMNHTMKEVANEKLTNEKTSNE